MQFRYEAKDSRGGMRTGLVVAESQDRAEALLAENDLTILSLAMVEENIFAKMLRFRLRVPAKEMVLFSRQLATLIGAQVPILQSLRILLAQVNHNYLKKVINETIKGIEAGDSLSLSISRHPEVFNDVYISVIHSGELSGSLENALNYLAEQVEKDYDLRTKTRGAMTYPLFVLGAVIVIGSLMFIFILPKLTGVLLEQGGQLPIVTIILIKFTKFFNAFWWLVFGLAIAIVFLFRYFINTTLGRYQWDAAKLKLPIVGPILVKIYLARFSRNLSTLIVGGIPIIKSLQLVSGLVNNVIYRDIILDAAQKLATGKTISDAFTGHDEFPPIVTQMIRVGEQSATLSNILLKLSVYYEKEVDQAVSSLATLLEPVIIIILGIAVGILVAGILLPIYNLANTVS